jgi:hypothetical protein
MAPDPHLACVVNQYDGHRDRGDAAMNDSTAGVAVTGIPVLESRAAGPPVTNRELREDGSLELREDGSVELRE